MKKENLNETDCCTCGTRNNNHTANCSQTESHRSKRNIAVMAAMFFLFLANIGNLSAQAFNIDQGRNGSAADPDSPVNWSNGNLTPTQAHYAEGYSVPYRAIATGLTPGVAITLRIGYDTKDNGKNALDYLTYYDRLTAPGVEHNLLFGHAPEVIDPLLGVTGVSSTIDLIAITAPASTVLATNLPAGSSQPLTSYNNLPAAERNMKIYGGTFVDGSFSYVSQDPIGATDASAKTVIQVTFIPDGATAVIAWGGHIASRLDWGYTDGVPNSAGGISGSPYHMRLISYSIDGVTTSLGNQDRSLKASAVAAPPPVCQVIPSMLEVCVGDTAQFLASATSGLPPYTFAWYKGNDFSTAIANTATLTINGAQASDSGTYHVIVTDDFGLSDTCHAHLTVHPLPTCSIGNISPATLLCNGGNYTITTPLAIADYSFNWDMEVDGNPAGWAIIGSDTLKTITFSAGDCDTLGFQVHFTLYVTNRVTGCQSSCSVSIGPRAPQCVVDIRPPVELNCNTTSQYLLATFSTEIVNPVYEWKRDTVSLGAGIVGTGVDSILITEPGIYYFYVRDTANSANTCFAYDTVYQDTARPVLTEIHTNDSCNGDSTGAIDLTVTGGTGPFDYLWSNGDTIQDISGLAAGGYTVVVTGANGCSDTLAVTITEPNALAIAETHTNVACNGDSTGAIDVTVTGGTPPYDYSWSNGPTTEDLSNLPSGAYKIIVTDSLGCADNKTINISEAADLAIAETHTNVTCYGDSSGAIDITVTGGTTPYGYAWNNGDTIEDIIGLIAGTYEVIVTDSVGCTDSLEVTLTEPADVSCLIDTPSVRPSCGSTGNMLVASVSGANSYVWSVVGTGWSITGGQGNDTIQYSAGSGNAIFKLVIENSNGCKDSCSIEISCVANDEFCSLTQGFYGNAKGVACATGQRGYDLLYDLLSSPLIIGKSGRMLTITQADVECVIKRLPAGGTPAMLPSGNHVFGSNCENAIPIGKNRRFNNVLLGQTITLGLNMRLDADLGSLVLAGTIMTTVDANPGDDDYCGTEDDIAIDSLVTVRYIPQSVLDALEELYGSATVANLFDLANRALGGQSTAGATLAEINQAVSAINEGFDHCKFLVGFTSGQIGLQQQTEIIEEPSGEVAYSAFPNPLKESTTIEFVSTTNTAIVVEVFNVEGQRVASLYRGNVTAGDVKRVLFDTGTLPNGIYIYKISSEGRIYTSKLMLMR